MESILQGVAFFHKGGFVMYILLVCSIFVITIAVERLLYFKQADSGRKFARQIIYLLEKDKLDEAAALAEIAEGALAEIVNKAMKKIDRKSFRLSSYLEIQSGIALSNFRRRLYYLNVIVTMAPLLGLLGTISGMISAFSIFNLESGQAAAITGGVGEALIATAMGLCVAIVALAIHAYFMQRIEAIITDMEQCFSMLENKKEQVTGHEIA